MLEIDFRLRISDATKATACINKCQLNHVKHAGFDLLTRKNRISIFKEYKSEETLTIGNPSNTLGGKLAVIIMLAKSALTGLVISSKKWLKMALIK